MMKSTTKLFNKLPEKQCRSFSHSYFKTLAIQQTSPPSLNCSLSSTANSSQCPHLNSNVGNETIKKYQEMPGPKGWPLLGNALDLAKNASNPVKYYTELVSKYGDMVKLKILNEKMVIITNPDHARILAREEEGRLTLHASRQYKIERGLVFVTLDYYTHENWNDIRQVLNIPLKPQYVSEIIIPQLTELNSDFLQLLIKHFKFDEKNEKFYIEDPTVEVTSPYAFGSVLKSFLGVRLTEEKIEKMGFTVKEFIDDGNVLTDLILKLQYSPPIYKYFKTKDYKTFEKVADLTFERANRAVRLFLENESNKPRLLELCQERAKETNLPPESTELCMSSFLTAGSDATAKMLNCLFYRIAHEKEYVERMFNELTLIFGEPTLDEVNSENGLLISPDHIKQLKLCKNFIDEVLRVDHILPVRNTRYLSKDMELGGYQLEKGTLVTFLDEVQTQSKHVPRGNEFLPERHEKGSELSEPKGYLGPFGRGARKCPGERIASTEILFALINVIRHFKLSHSNGDQFPPFSADKSVMFIDPTKYRVFFTPREHLIPHLNC